MKWKDILYSDVKMNSDIEPLILPKYQWWFNAIISNDSKIINESLSNLDKQEKEKLINNKFSWTKEIYKTFNNIDTSESALFQIATPFCLAVARAAKNSIQELMDNGVDVTILEFWIIQVTIVSML